MQQPAKILIVDDVAIYRKALTHCLLRSRYIVTGACEHNLEMIGCEIGKDCPALAFISFKTTRRNTLNTFEWMRIRYPDIKQVMTTLYPSGYAQREAIRLDTQGLLVKSFDMEIEIIAMLQTLFT